MIDKFRDKYDFLSNFYECEVIYNGLLFHSAEAAFQSAKAENPKEKILFTHYTASAAKKEGRLLQLPRDWNESKLRVMETVVRNKFYSNYDIAKKLIDTNNEELVEGNTWNDTYWGICRNKGENHLGKILMKIRSELKDLNILGLCKECTSIITNKDEILDYPGIYQCSQCSHPSNESELLDL